MRRPCVCHVLLSVSLLLSVFTTNSYGVTECVSSADDLALALYYAAESSEDDVIQIVQGTYLGGFVYASSNDSNLTIEGGYTEECAARVADPTNTILDGENGDRVLSLSSTHAANISIDTLTIQNGYWASSYGGGVLILTEGGDVSVTASIFKNNLVNSYGGGLYVDSNAGEVFIQGNLFADNDSTGSSFGWGGGARINNSGLVTVNTNSFLRNIGGQGGGISIGTNTGSIVITNNTFEGNDALTDRGSGIHCSGPIQRIENNTIVNGSSGGGIYASLSGSGGGYKGTYSNNIIQSNVDGPGLRLAIATGSEATIVNNLITGNSAYSTLLGGGLHIDYVRGDTDLTITNNTITGNFTPGDGGGLKIRSAENEAHIFINSNIIWNNMADGEGNDIYINDDEELDTYFTPVEMLANDFDQSEYGFYIKNPVYLLLLDPSNLDNTNPFFAPGADDYRLNDGSLCINSGNNLARGISLTDLGGNPRIMGGVVDMGAYEYPGPVLPVAVFGASPLAGPIPLTVNFSDYSMGTVTSWLWNFGDGATSSEQSPTHMYTTEGSHTVSLTVTGPEGSTTEIKNGLIVAALAAPLASAGQDRAIAQHDITLDASGSSDADGNIVSYEWQLVHRDDPANNLSATGVAPYITGLHSGFYDVQLQVTDDDGLTGLDTMILAVSEPWDVNNDQSLGLEEAIHILRILTGE